jgi:hypothetical protein
MIKMTQLVLAVAVALALSDMGFAQDTSPRSSGATTPRFSALVSEAIGQDPLPEPLPMPSSLGL